MSTSARIDSVEPIDASAEPGTEPRPSAISSNGGSRRETPSTETPARTAGVAGRGSGRRWRGRCLRLDPVARRGRGGFAHVDGAAAFGSALALVSVGLPWVVFPVWHGLMARAGHRGRSGGSPSPADLVIGVVGLAVVGWLVGLGLGSLHGHAAADARWIGVGTLVSVASIAGAWWVVGAGWLALERRPKAGVGADAVGSWQWRWIAAVLGGGAIAVGGVLVDWSPWAVLALGSLAMAVAVMGRMRFYASHRDHSVLPAASAPTSLARGVTVGVMLAAVLTVDRIVFWLCAREAFAPSHPLYETCLILARASVLPGLCWVAWLVRRDVLSRYRAWTMAQAVGRSTEQVIATRVATARAAARCMAPVAARASRDHDGVFVVESARFGDARVVGRRDGDVAAGVRRCVVRGRLARAAVWLVVAQRRSLGRLAARLVCSAPRWRCPVVDWSRPIRLRVWLRVGGVARVRVGVVVLGPEPANECRGAVGPAADPGAIGVLSAARARPRLASFPAVRMSIDSTS